MARNKKMSDPRAKGRRGSKAQEPAGALAPDYELDYDDDSSGISLRSMKRAGKYMWIAIFFMILCIGLIIGYKTLYNSSLVSAQRSCWLEQQNIETLANRYITDNGLSSMPAYVEDIPEYDKVYAPCPSGGGYTWNPVLGTVSCSEHGHYPSSFNKAQSQVQGSQSIAINANNSSK